VGNFKVSGTLGRKTVTVPIERAVDQMLCRELDEKCNTHPPDPSGAGVDAEQSFAATRLGIEPLTVP